MSYLRSIIKYTYYERESRIYDEEGISSSNGKAVQSCSEKCKSKQDEYCRILTCLHAVVKKEGARLPLSFPKPKSLITLFNQDCANIYHLPKPASS